MNDKTGIAQVGKPVQLSWNNRRVITKENTKGEFFCLVQFEFDEEAWGFLKTIPRNANGEMVIWVTEIGMEPEKPKKEKKPKDPKGPFSFMWEYLHPYGKHEGRGFVTLPGVKEAIEDERISNTEDVWPILHRVFDHVLTLANVGPDAVLAKFPDNPPVKLAVGRAMKFQNDKESKQ